MELYTPLVEHMKLDVRMNLKTRKVELKTTKRTELQGALHRPHRGQGWQDALYHRERHAHAHRAGRHAHPPAGRLCQHQGGAGRHLRAHPRLAAGQGLLQAQGGHAQAARRVACMHARR